MYVMLTVGVQVVAQRNGDQVSGNRGNKEEGSDDFSYAVSLHFEVCLIM